MYLVTIEQADGTWFDDPNGFDTEREAREFAATRGNAPGISVEVYECRLLAALSPQETVE